MAQLRTHAFRFCRLHIVGQHHDRIGHTPGPIRSPRKRGRGRHVALCGPHKRPQPATLLGSFSRRLKYPAGFVRRGSSFSFPRLALLGAGPQLQSRQSFYHVVGEASPTRTLTSPVSSAQRRWQMPCQVDCFFPWCPASSRHVAVSGSPSLAASPESCLRGPTQRVARWR